ncbi:isopropylmalate isomerase, partial [Candidatus Uhrbacteria bacterium RIFCSPLOWO2_12_FULL_46_10]
ENGIRFFGLGDARQGIVHVIGPELGLTQPGMTIACGDSHTSTHGAFGNIAFGIGTTQVANVLASQCLLVERPKVRQIKVTGRLQFGVTAKDVILAIIGQLGVNGGIGYAYEYAGDVIRAMTMDERMTVCNMTIEGGAKCGYINPDQTTINYLSRAEPYAPKGNDFERLSQWWLGLASHRSAEYDDVVVINGTKLEPMVTWGITPADVVGVTKPIPDDGNADAFEFMGFRPGQRVLGTKIDVAFIGSCTNGRVEDLREAAYLIQRKGLKVASHVRALVVPGSVTVRRRAEAEGLHEIFQAAGFEWRDAGCSMCLGMNPDKLVGNQVCASSSNRNFKGRQGSPTGRTLLMSPIMVAAAAAAGEVVDVRKFY